jgi:hypothetical protein
MSIMMKEGPNTLSLKDFDDVFSSVPTSKETSKIHHAIMQSQLKPASIPTTKKFILVIYIFGEKIPDFEEKIGEIP